MGAFEPPVGSQDIPHPRTAHDIIVRSISIQIFAAAAYLHLLYLLRFRKPHGAGALSWLLVPCFLCLPELILLQLAFAIIPICIAPPYRRRVATRFKGLPYELGLLSAERRRGGGSSFTHATNSPTTGLPRLGMHTVFAVGNLIPLAAVLGAYRQRLRISYHQMTYAGNLGIDHRNGLAALGGIVAIAITLLIIVLLVAIIGGGAAEPNPDAEHYDNHASHPNGHALLPRSEPESPSASSELPNAAVATVDSEGSGSAAARQLLGETAAEHIDWSTVLELLYVTVVHQFVLAATHQPVPALLLLQAWFLWPLAGVAIWWLATRVEVPLETLALGHALFWIALNMGAPLMGNAVELWNVTHGVLAAWNFRWAVKDWVSTKHAPDH